MCTVETSTYECTSVRRPKKKVSMKCDPRASCVTSYLVLALLQIRGSQVVLGLGHVRVVRTKLFYVDLQSTLYGGIN